MNNQEFVGTTMNLLRNLLGFEIGSEQELSTMLLGLYS